MGEDAELMNTVEILLKKKNEIKEELLASFIQYYHPNTDVSILAKRGEFKIQGDNETFFFDEKPVFTIKIVSTFIGHKKIYSFELLMANYHE